MKSNLYDISPGLTEIDFEQKLHNKTSGYLEFFLTISNADGELGNQHVFGQHLQFEGEEALLIIWIDVSEVKDQEIRLLDKMIDVLEDERRRVSSELHDGITQYFGMANGISKSLKESIEQAETVNILDGLNRITELTAKGIQDSRSMSHALVPDVSNDLESMVVGFVENLKYIKKMAFTYDSNITHRYNETAVLNLYRILQEAIRNVIRHSEATLVTIRIYENKNSLILEVADNGKGFDTTFMSKSIESIGLKTMRTRAQKLHGLFILTSEPKIGTSLTVKIPVSGNKLEQKRLWSQDFIRSKNSPSH